MSNKKYQNKLKVLSTLSLASTDAREDTLASIVLSTLVDVGEVEKRQLLRQVEKKFNFTPFQQEVESIIEKLEEEERLEVSNGTLYISNDEKNNFKSKELELNEKDKSRYKNFKNFLVNENNLNLEDDDIKKLWHCFIEYLYDNFYDYGEAALNRLHPFLESNLEFEENKHLEEALNKLNDEKLNDAFKLAVKSFPDYASQDDIDFLNDLAQKTLSFTSLGIDPKLSDVAIDISLVDWFLYLDTNILYSLLDLHYHYENQSSKALTDLINDNKSHLNITLRYSEMTKKELLAKKEDFKHLDKDLSDSGIKAALKSKKLDEFSKQYYNDLLQDRDSSLHPSKIVELSQEILKKRDVDIARNQKRLENLGEDYLNEKIQEYHRFIDQKNDFRQEFCEKRGLKFNPIYKSEKQIEHDIYLRELILDLRFSEKRKNEDKELDFNTLKYFGLTLDRLLIEFDTHQINKFQDEKSFPVFFKPSYLLNKLYRLLPIQTNDYKKAFIKAITTKGFNNESSKSRDVIRIIKYLNKIGINDEKIIFNLVSKDLFLEQYSDLKNNEDDQLKNFFESELNKQFRTKEEELRKTKVELNKKNNIANNATQKTNELQQKSDQLSSDLKLYKNSLNKLNTRIEKLKTNVEKPSSQIDLDFDKSDEIQKLKKSNNETQREFKNELNKRAKNFREQEVKKWQKQLLWHLIWILPFTTFIIIFIVNTKAFINDDDFELDFTSIRIVLGVFLLILDGYFIQLIKFRFIDEKNISEKRDKFELPDDLQSKLNRFQDT